MKQKYIDTWNRTSTIVCACEIWSDIVSGKLGLTEATDLEWLLALWAQYGPHDLDMRGRLGV